MNLTTITYPYHMKRLSSIATIIISLGMIIPLSACSSSVIFNSTASPTSSHETSSPSSSHAQSSSDASVSDAKSLSSWSSDIAPNYYVSSGKAILPSTLVPTGTIDYQGSNSQGKAGYAHAVITYKMIADSAGWRAKFDSDVDEIAGWKNPTTGKSNNRESTIALVGKTKVYHGYFYNRSHLVADSLGGAPSKKNLITGTRMQNVGDNSAHPGGMAYAESKVRSYMKQHQNVTTAYYVQPVYQGDEIVPRGVTIDMRSSDNHIDEHVIVWNYANGHTIDYHTGAWQ